jgi:hypothetical protein
MDYGYQLLRHVVQQVFGNLGQAARLTGLLTVLPYLFGIFVIGSLVGWDFLTHDPTASYDAQRMDEIGRRFLEIGPRLLVLMPLIVLVAVICYAWAAIGWHRYVLLEESGAGLLPTWNWDLVKSYLWAVIRIFLIALLTGFALGFAIGVAAVAVQSPAFFFFLGIGYAIALTWVITRVGLILPSAALGQPMRIGESWTLTEPVSGAILLPIIVIPIVFALLNGLLQIVPVVGLLLSFVLGWLQVLVNLALMTTLYGNLVEGRALN